MRAKLAIIQVIENFFAGTHRKRFLDVSEEEISALEYCLSFAVMYQGDNW